VRRNRRHRGHTGGNPGGTTVWAEEPQVARSSGNHQSGLAGCRGGRTCRGSRVPMVKIVEPDSKRKSRSVRLGEAANGKLSSSKTTYRETIG
jgi:hypothetical protein